MTLIRDKNEKELFEFIRTADSKNIQPLKSILKDFRFNACDIGHLLGLVKNENEKVLLIDARSENEFENSSIPFSKSFPVLNNSERHNVGLIYKKYSQTSALWLAMKYADPKIDSLKKFLAENNAPQKNIFVYCWRGGGRSGYLAKMISDAGYKADVLTGGHRSYRRVVNDFFGKKEFSYGLIEISGPTGSGKTELLRRVSGKLPVIDLESAARHYSSLLGHIPYEIKNISPVRSQSAFENNIFAQIHFNPHNIRSGGRFLIESESKRVGNFEIPKSIYDKMLESQSVRIVGSMGKRVERIVRDYFADRTKGTELMRGKLLEKEKFFRQQLSAKTFSALITKLERGDVESFTEMMIKEYYDKKYKDKGKASMEEINTDDMDSAVEKLVETYRRFSG